MDICLKSEVEKTAKLLKKKIGTTRAVHRADVPFTFIYVSLCVS